MDNIDSRAFDSEDLIRQLNAWLDPHSNDYSPTTNQGSNSASLFIGSMNESIFDQVENNTAFDEQPTFDATTKREALAQLRKTCPKASKEDIKKLAKAAGDFTGQGSCRPDGTGKWQVKGMIARLEHYQVVGVAEMRLQETQKHGLPYGGIFAYQMGLGKTIMCLANIVNGRFFAKGLPTLIVVKSGLVSQWEEEYEKHVEQSSKAKILRWSSGHKLDPKYFKQFTEDVEIILTTYHEVKASHPKRSSQKPGLFHSMKFHRVILDEGHEIKNHDSATSKACCALDATHYWAVTGTPIQNSLEEFCAYFLLLRLPHIGSFKEFKKNFFNKSNPQEGLNRLIALIKPFTLRKTLGDEFMGAKLVQLPTPSKSSITCNMTEIEQSIYNIVHARISQLISDSREGPFRNPFILLMRLRQCSSHILLLNDCIENILEPEDFKEIEEALSNFEAKLSQEQATLYHLRMMLRPQHHRVTFDDIQTSSTSPDQILETGTADETFIGNPSHVETSQNVQDAGVYGKRNDLRAYMSNVRVNGEQIKAEQDIICPKCKKPPNQRSIVSCGHTYCYSCLLEMSHDASTKGAVSATCLECGQIYSGLMPSNLKADQLASAGLAGVDDKKPKKKSAREVINQWVDGDGNMILSTKTLAVKSYIMNALEKEPDVKIIVYTQFSSIIRILSKVCEMENWGFCQYHGQMSAQSRNATVRAFAENKETNIMLATLQSGGVGLNLTMASQVVIMEPWWNTAIEEQAFCRTFRRGQSRNTKLLRIFCANTVDDKIREIQIRKKNEIDPIMNSAKSLSQAEIKDLFSSKKRSAHGAGFVMPRTKKPKDDGVSRTLTVGDDDDDHDDGAIGGDNI